MKKTVLILMLVCCAISFSGVNVYADLADILLKKMVEKKMVTEDEAKQMLEEAKKEAAQEKVPSKEKEQFTEVAKAKTLAVSIPEWTQKINMKGDVRFRTEDDWGKGINPSHARIRERVRARIGVEGKVNDVVTGGARLVTGGTGDPRSTNITLGDSTSGGDFAKTTVSFDQFYLKFEPNKGYLNGLKLWLGKFPIPFECNDYIWDPDINPEGIAAQYMSPSLNFGDLPGTKLYANGGMLWLLEIAKADTDPMMWGAQLGFISKLNEKYGTTLNTSMAVYDVTRMKNRNWATVATAGTNSLQTLSDAGGNTSFVNTLKYDYHPIDLIVRLDNKNIFGINIPEGLYGDFVYNASANSSNTGYLLGGYLGERNIKDFGQWSTWIEWRNIGRDAVPDILADSDFYGFTVTGVPAGGGTNTNGFVTGFQFGLFKNTWLSLKYSWSEPLKATNIGQGTESTSTPFQLIQADVNAKF